MPVAEALAEIERQTRADVLIIEDELIIAMDIEIIVRDPATMSPASPSPATRRSPSAGAPPRLVLADIQLADDSRGSTRSGTSAEFQVPVSSPLSRSCDHARPEADLPDHQFQRATVKAAIAWPVLRHTTVPPDGPRNCRLRASVAGL